MTDDNLESLPLNALLSDSNSNGNVENLLDVVAALVWDCNFQSAKNSKAIQSFVQRFVIVNMYVFILHAVLYVVYLNCYQILCKRFFTTCIYSTLIFSTARVFLFNLI